MVISPLKNFIFNKRPVRETAHPLLPFRSGRLPDADQHDSHAGRLVRVGLQQAKRSTHDTDRNDAGRLQIIG